MLRTKVHSKQEILDSINESIVAISAFGVKSIGLFGSFVKNSATESSGKWLAFYTGQNLTF
jgi:hypothetical protein